LYFSDEAKGFGAPDGQGDPGGGGSVAEKSMRKWIAIDMVKEYLKGSEFRFPRVYR